MKLFNMIALGGFSALAIASWSSPVYGQGNWTALSWFRDVPGKAEKVIESGTVSWLSFMSQGFDKEAAVQVGEREKRCSGEVNPVVEEANPSDFSVFLKRAKSKPKVQTVSDLLGARPYCFVSTNRLLWLMEGGRIVEVEFDQYWRLQKGEVKNVSIKSKLSAKSK